MDSVKKRAIMSVIVFIVVYIVSGILIGVMPQNKIVADRKFTAN